VPSAADHIAALVAAHGALRFDDYLDAALYGDHGFYATGGGAGRRGDFITSPEVGPLFGAVVARFIFAEWERIGRPHHFTVVEVGAGPGTLARSVTKALATSALPVRYIAVEVSAAQRAAHPEGVESVDAVPTAVTHPFAGVIIANELLDNLPFRLLVFDDGWREAYVAFDGGRLVEVLRPLDEHPVWLPESAPHGARVPWQQSAARWVTESRALLRAGSVLAFDYTTDRTVDLAHMPWREWLRTYRQHERGVHYLLAAGEQDITAQVALDQLPPPDSLRSQEQFLQLWGIDELVEEGRREWAAAAGAPTLAALTMRSRIREAEALLDRTGLGGFLAITWMPET
jgi:SAM-dependent MidA family methyltransferase